MESFYWISLFQFWTIFSKPISIPENYFDLLVDFPQAYPDVGCVSSEFVINNNIHDLNFKEFFTSVHEVILHVFTIFFKLPPVRDYVSCTKQHENHRIIIQHEIEPGAFSHVALWIDRTWKLLKFIHVRINPTEPHSLDIARRLRVAIKFVAIRLNAL